MIGLPGPPPPATAAGRRGTVVAVLLMVAGGLAISSIAFPYWEFRGPFGGGTIEADWDFTGECRSLGNEMIDCVSYSQLEASEGANASGFLVPLANGMFAAGALAVVFGIALEVAGVFHVLAGWRGSRTSYLSRGVQRLALPGTLGFLAAAITVPLGVEGAVKSPGVNSAGGCASAFFAFCGRDAWFAGPGWFMLVAATGLGVLALALMRKSRKEGSVRDPVRQAQAGEAPGVPGKKPPAPPPATLW